MWKLIKLVYQDSLWKFWLDKVGFSIQIKILSWLFFLWTDSLSFVSWLCPVLTEQDHKAYPEVAVLFTNEMVHIFQLQYCRPSKQLNFQTPSWKQRAFLYGTAKSQYLTTTPKEFRNQQCEWNQRSWIPKACVHASS
jgi:hypothetical protein